MEWYPNKKRANDLSEILEKVGQTWDPNCVSDDIYQHLSSAVFRLVELAGSDPYLIHDWVWTAAQLRIAHPQDKTTAERAWAGIIVFLDLVSKMEAGDRDLLPALRWLTDRVVENLIDAAGPESVDRFVSSSEKERIDDLLLRLAETTEPELPALLSAAERLTKDLASVHHAAYFPSVLAKLRSLMDFASEDTEASYWAKAALRYVCLEHDVIDDAQGYMGFLDDIQVIEDVYELIHGELSWREFINRAIAEWPMLARIYWTDGSTTNHLPPLLKVAAACTMESTLDDKRERVIVAPEIGPMAFVSAALCALADLKREPLPEPPLPGTFVTFRQGHAVRFAQISEPYDAGDGVILPMVTLRDSTISIPPAFAVLLEPATVENPRFATAAELNEWMRTREADQFMPMERYQRVSPRPFALYVTDRSRFFAMMEQIKPFGRKLDELVPIAYQTRGGHKTIGTGAATVAPAITVCNDLATAEASIKIAAKDGRLPRCVIIDRSVDPNSLRSLTHRCQELDPNIRVVIFAAPEAARKIAPDENKTSTWLIRPEEVEPIFQEKPSNNTREVGKGPLETFNRRQVSATHVDITTIPVSFDELDRFAALASRIVRRARNEKDVDLESIAIACEATLRQISHHCPLGAHLQDERIEAALKNVSALAGVHGLFDEEIAEVGELADTLMEALGSLHPKDSLINEIFNQYEDVCVLVGSRAVAEKMKESFVPVGGENPRFIAPHDLEQTENIRVLVVPSWFGTQEMRRIILGGWAPIQIRVLFDYEIGRLEGLNRRLAREFQLLARRTRRSWASFAAKKPDVVPPPPKEENPPSEPTIDHDRESDNSNWEGDSDWLEAAIRKRMAMKCRLDSPRDLVLARLVFFDDGLHFGVFAKDASLICLNEVLGGGSDGGEIDEREAEKLLWKKTNSLAPGDILAFPDDPSYSDVIDELADALMADGGKTRNLAGLWRVAVRSVVEQCGGDFGQARQRFAKFGVDRELSTLNAWLYSSKTVAPKRPEEAIPALLKCSGDDDLLLRSEDILRAASAVYASRRKAGHALVAQLSSAPIRASYGAAHVEIGGKYVRYRLLAVATVDGVATFASGDLGLHTTEYKISEAPL